ncbi:hypothetical protein LV78_004213 [Actinosynnema pretiosum]|nr:hypothetical protein [Actinosynnema pretiosum]
MVKFARKAAAVAAGTVLMLAASTHAASAAEHGQTPPDGGGSGYVSHTHQYLRVCDTSANDRGVRIEYTVGGSGTVYKLGDSNGAKKGCGTRSVGPREVISFRVCSSKTGGGDSKCRAWEWIGAA